MRRRLCAVFRIAWQQNRCRIYYNLAVFLGFTANNHVMTGEFFYHDGLAVGRFYLLDGSLLVTTCQVHLAWRKKNARNSQDSSHLSCLLVITGIPRISNHQWKLPAPLQPLCNATAPRLPSSTAVFTLSICIQRPVNDAFRK